MPSAEAVVEQLRSLADPEGRDAMSRFGIDTSHALGVRIPQLRKLARRLGRDHALALALWRTGIHEARILASMVDEPERVTERQMESWARGFGSWDLCDQVCGNLFDRTPYARAKAVEWAGRDEEFVKRAGFALMAWLAVHDKRSGDEVFLMFLPVIERESDDDRNFVKKATSWALRQIGKRNLALRREAVASARRIADRGSRAARWIASDALRELEG